MLRLVPILFALAACATASSYAPAARPHAPGFSESRIEPDRYRVTYQGGSGDAHERVADLALLRAAELTLEAGFDWFAVAQRSEEAGRDSGPRFSIGIGGGRFGRHSTVGVGVSAPIGASAGARGGAVSLEIRLGRGAKPADANAYDAREVQSAVRARM